ncbi:PEPxxWA-CTERM sorting domain-containing protein [Phenylobacterium sp.]|uniref:PEPxxWA-CTERM sorting domain-containing protein n=1 Tax=Phenylobacterium sp. TaxID=1871053 RepID=UPI0025DFBB62|nr:PEPxxWA-CTERM sorting domain-containing protein [Phenylobacterium sp.]MBX3485711.1 PEP-CTERM sorting domain-containing protein [Phenylobacterium sp.]
MKIGIGLVAGAMLAVAALPAAAGTTITFDERTSAGGVATGNFESGGFLFSYAIDNGVGFRSWGVEGEFAPYNADPDGATLFDNGGLDPSFAPVGGGAFALVSIDIADIYNGRTGGLPTTTYFTATKAGGGVTTQSFTVDPVPGLTTFVFDSSFANVLSVAWYWIPDGAFHGRPAQLDNIVVGEAVTGGVPEPSAWALMILGFGTAGAAMRRRSRPAPQV